MKAQGIVEYALILVLIVVITIVFIAVSTDSKAPKMDIVTATEATLGQRLIFPKGYHLVAFESYAYQATGPYTTYICQSDDDHADYRICSPEKVSDK